MIVVGGEALVDLVPSAATTPGELGPLLPRPGGGPFNTAVALGRLGADVSFLSRLSTDGFGDALLDRLHAAGVRTDLVTRGPEPTTLAVVTLAGDGGARYAFHVLGTADRLVTDPGPLPDEVTAVSLGTLSLVLEPGATAYETVLRREAARGRLTVLDPNIRAGLVDDPAAYRARFLSWLPDIGVLKVSEDDARWLGGTDDVQRLVRDWLAAGVTAVVLTRGAGGISVRTAGPRVAVPSAPAAVVDTIGAGDTVHAALLAWLDRHDAASPDGVAALDESGWTDALGFAARAAALTVGRVGAQPPYAAEIISPENPTGRPG
ncbi:MAG TPA: carbohydrate kinase [Pseudonocardiaceae bacterium]|nr:carbohydrate kinase [Pseudonocardiaceae bacterium]